MSIKKVAIAVFVKTPGYSPVKTRLARTEGSKLAHKFHRFSANAVKSVIENWAQESKHQVSPYWAVSEQTDEVGEKWPDFKLIGQKGKCLGARLHSVYSELLENYDQVILIGADAPQITKSNLETAVLANKDFIMGKSHDGGFYLFAGRKKIPENVWTGITYSAETTANDLLNRLQAPHVKTGLPILTDMDNIDSLEPLINEMESAERILMQDRLLGWLEELAARTTILFLCTGNSCRSQMAEGWSKELIGERFRIFSAGIESHGINPEATAVMQEVGIDIAIQESSLIEHLPVRTFNHAYTMCSHAESQCPNILAHRRKHVPFDDPPKMAESFQDTEAKRQCYREVRDKIKNFIEKIKNEVKIKRQGGYFS